MRTNTLMASLAFSPHGVNSGANPQSGRQSAVCPPKQSLLLRMPLFIAPRSSSMVARGADTACKESEENWCDEAPRQVHHMTRMLSRNQPMPLTMHLSNTSTPLQLVKSEMQGSHDMKFGAPLPLPSSPVAMSAQSVDEAEATTPPTLRRRLFPQPGSLDEMPA